MCCGCVPSGDARYVARVVGSGKDDLQGVDVQGEEEVEECILWGLPRRQSSCIGVVRVDEQIWSGCTLLVGAQ